MRATAKISLIVSFFVLSKSKVHIIQKTSFHFCLLLAVGESQLTACATQCKQVVKMSDDEA